MTTVTIETINSSVEEIVAKMFREAIQAEAARLVDAAISRCEPAEVVTPAPDPTPESTEHHQCEGMTTRGRRCDMVPPLGQKFCAWHRGKHHQSTPITIHTFTQAGLENACNTILRKLRREPGWVRVDDVRKNLAYPAYLPGAFHTLVRDGLIEVKNITHPNGMHGQQVRLGSGQVAAPVPEPVAPVPEPPPPEPEPAAPVPERVSVPAPRKRTTPKYTSTGVAWHRLILAAQQVTTQTGDKLNRTWQAVYNDDYPAAWSSLQKVITDHHLKIDLAQQQRKASS